MNEHSEWEATELITTERVAIVTERLVLGEALTPRCVADMFGITRGGGWSILTKVSRVLPLYNDDTGAYRYLPRSTMR